MKIVLNLALLLAAVSLAGQAGAAAEKQKERITDFAAFTVPEGWTRTELVEQGDPQLRLEKGFHTITIRLAGGSDSRYRTAGEFLAGFEARFPGGKQAEKIGTLVVSGTRVLRYRLEIPLSLPPQGEGGPATMAPEEFCLVPAGKRFFILTYSYGDTIPDMSYDGNGAWTKFLKSFRAFRKR